MKFFLLYGVVVLLLLSGAFVLSTVPVSEAPGGLTDQTTEQASIIERVTETVADVGESGGRDVVIYDGIVVSSGAKTIDISGRSLTGSLKAEIRQVASLEVLDVSDNAFTGLPAEVGQLTELRVLNLSNNSFTGLPHELGNLQQLEVLDARGNNVSSGDMDVITAKLPPTTEVLR